jgi:putative ABC transport system permease protein
VFNDLRHGLRLVVRNPGFAIVVVLILGFGIGASSTIFSFVSALVLRPLAIEGVGTIAQIFERLPDSTNRQRVSFPNVVDWQTRSDAFEQIAALRFENPAFAAGDQPERILVLRASATIFPLLRLQMTIGRAFTAEDDRAGAERVAILTNGFWRTHFGGDPNAVGRTIRLDGNAVTVIGVLRNDPEYFGLARVWVPLALSGQANDRSAHFLSAIGRLKEDATFRNAQAQLDAIAATLPDNRIDGRQLGVLVVPFQESLVDFIYPALAVAMAAAGFLLLIACANVANLVLARGVARTREIAIRSSLGATRFRIVRQLLTESVVLSSLGGIVGLLVCHWSIGPLINLSPENQRLVEIGIDGRVLCFVLLVGMLTSFVFGLVPALKISQPSRFSSRHRARSVLVVSEVALALILLAGTGLLLKSYHRVQRVATGLNSDNLLTIQMSIPAAKYPREADVLRFYAHTLDEIGSLPGVETAATVQMLPFGGRSQFAPFDVTGTRAANSGGYGLANQQVVSAGYFRTAGIGMRTGRSFSEQDTEGALRVAIINQELARRVWQGEDPIGHQIRIGPPEWRQPWLTIVGIVNDVMHYGLDQQTPLEIYVPFKQAPVRESAIIVRTTSEPLSYAGAARQRIFEIDRDQAVSPIRTMEQVIDDSLWQRRVLLLVMVLFAGVALVLCSTGLYGIISYSIQQRRTEFAIRVALGAKNREILKLAIGESVRLALAGIGVGLAAGVVLLQGMSSVLYGIEANDAATFAVMASLLFLVTLIAAYIPGRSATKADPVSILKTD